MMTAFVIIFLISLLSAVLYYQSYYQSGIAKKYYFILPVGLGLVGLLYYLFLIRWSPTLTAFNYEIASFSMINIKTTLGIIINPANTLLILTSLFVFVVMSLNINKGNNQQKDGIYSLCSIFFSLFGILSMDVVMFAFSWGIVGLIDCAAKKEKEKGVKLFYTGLDIILMYFGLLVLSISFKTTVLSTINEIFTNLLDKDKALIYVASLLLSLSVLMRSLLLPFFFNSESSQDDELPLYKHISKMITVVPLGIFLIIKINSIAAIPILSSLFFILGLTIAPVSLAFALSKDNIEEMLSLGFLAVNGIIYGMLGLGQVSSAIFIFIAVQILGTSLELLSLKIKESEKARIQKFLFWSTFFVVGSYIGLPGLTNFFLFFDTALVFFNVEKFFGGGICILLFFILNGLLQVKILLGLFDIKLVFSSVKQDLKIDKGIFVPLMAGILSFILVFYSVPENLSAGGNLKLKNLLSKYLQDVPIEKGSVQSQNIIMILLAFCIMATVSIGFYLHILRKKYKYLETLKKRVRRLSEFVDSNNFLHIISNVLIGYGFKEERSLEKKNKNIFEFKALTNILKAKNIDIFFVQIFALGTLGGGYILFRIWFSK